MDSLQSADNMDWICQVLANILLAVINISECCNQRKDSQGFITCLLLNELLKVVLPAHHAALLMIVLLLSS